MSVKVMAWVFDHSPAELGERLVLLAIADNASDDGTNAWPSVSTLARKTRMSERNVQYCLRKLETDGLILTERAVGPRGTNRYTVVMVGGAKFAPGEVGFTGGGAKFAPQGVKLVAPEPSLNHPKTTRTRVKCPVHLLDFPCRSCAADRKAAG